MTRNVSCCGSCPCRRCAGPGAGFERIDKDHRPATARARITERWRLIVVGGLLGQILAWRHVEQVPGAFQVLGAMSIGEQAVMADAMEAIGQHVEEKAPNEFGGGQGHELLAILAFGPVVFVLEGDAVAVAGDQPAV